MLEGTTTHRDESLKTGSHHTEDIEKSMVGDDSTNVLHNAMSIRIRKIV